MYSNNINHGIHFSLQRLLLSYRCFVTILTIFLFCLFFYYYNESLGLVKTQEIQLSQCQQKLESMSAQLQVVYEHKSRLEKALAADRDACTKRMNEMTKNLQSVKEGSSKSEAEVKAAQWQLADLQKQLANVTQQKLVSDQAASKAGVDVENAKEVYTKEIEVLKGENLKLNDQVAELKAALNKSYERVYSLQQQVDQNEQRAGYVSQGGQAQQQQHPVVDRVSPPPPQANQPPAQPSSAAHVANDHVLPAPPANSQHQPPPPPANAHHPPHPATPVPQPRAEQVALPIAERHQRQLYEDQRRAPMHLPGPPAGPAPPAAPNNADAVAPAPGAAVPAAGLAQAAAQPAVAAPAVPVAAAVPPPPAATSLLQQQQQAEAPLPAPAGQQQSESNKNNNNDAAPVVVAPAPAVADPAGPGQGAAGAVKGFADIEPQVIDHQFDQHRWGPAGGEEEKDADEANDRKQREEEMERRR